MESLHLRLSAIVLTFGVLAHADETDTAKAKAALALAKVKREREHAKTSEISAMTCHMNLTEAEREVERTGKRLVLWVGVTCNDHPQLRQLLDVAVHCHVDKWRGDDEPRIVIRGGDGNEYFVYPAKMTDETKTAANIKKAWAKVYVPPPDPPKRAGVSEELSRKAKAAPCDLCGLACDCGAGCVCDREAVKRKAGGMASRSVGETIVQVPPAYYTMPVYYTMPQPAPSRSVGIGAGFNVGRFGASVGACIGGG